jgi:hypothetical protein
VFVQYFVFTMPLCHDRTLFRYCNLLARVLLDRPITRKRMEEWEEEKELIWVRLPVFLHYISHLMDGVNFSNA